MPEGDTEENCHLMVECMECWILVDRKTIAAFFGTGFRENALPSEKNAGIGQKVLGFGRAEKCNARL